MKEFKLTPSQWSKALDLTTASHADRLAFWTEIGAERGFDPTTVEVVRNRTITAKLVPTAPARSAARRAAKVTKATLEIDRHRPAGREAVGVPAAEQHTRVVVQDEEGTFAQIDQINCSRCGKNHHGITYRRLSRPVHLAGEELTHYAWCPTTGEPVLLLIRDRDDVRVPTDLARLLDDNAELVPEEEFRKQEGLQ